MLVVDCDPQCNATLVAADHNVTVGAPAGRQIPGRAAIDVSTHMRSVEAYAGRLDPVRQQIWRILICGRHERIDVYSAPSGSTAAVFDGDLRIPGSSLNARLRRDLAMTEEVMAQIQKNVRRRPPNCRRPAATPWRSSA
ncbi:hypothetical protein ACWDUL_39590 [Nocardia niigatensis]